MKQFFKEFIGLAIVVMILFWSLGLFFPEEAISWKINIYTSLGASAVYCIAKALDNGYGEDADDD